MTIKAKFFKSNNLSGSVVVEGQQIIYSEEINPIDFEGDQNFTVKFRKNNANSPVIFSSDTITIRDTANLSIFAPNVTTVNEGDLVKFDIVGTGIVAPNLRLYYSTLGNVSYADFAGGNTGAVTLVNGVGNVVLKTNADALAQVEEGEQFLLQLRLDSTTGTVFATSNTVVILKDTSNSLGITSVEVSSNLIYETHSSIITVNTINATGNAGATLYYSITGNADIYGANTGSIIINENTANLEVIAETIIPEGNVDYFQVQIRSSSVSGTILDTSDRVYVQNFPEANVIPGKISAVSGISTSYLIYDSESATVTVNTVAASNGEVLYYTTTGNAEIYANAEGSFELNGNTGSFEIITEATVPISEVRTIDVKIRRGSNVGKIIYELDTIYVQYGGPYGLSATGGDEVITVDI